MSVLDITYSHYLFLHTKTVRLNKWINIKSKLSFFQINNVLNITYFICNKQMYKLMFSFAISTNFRKREEGDLACPISNVFTWDLFVSETLHNFYCK